MKYLACDLDGTLLEKNQSISKENIEAIIKFKEAGNKFIISTGRDVESIYNLFKNYPEIDYDYIVACNGSVVLDKYKEVIFKDYINNEIAEEIFNDFIEEKDICIHFNAEGRHYLVDSKGIQDESSQAEDINKIILKFKDKISIKDLFSEKRRYSFISIFSTKKDIEVAEKSKNLIIKRYGQGLEAFRNQYFIDIAPKNCSKGNALRKLLKINDVDTKNLYAIGDSFNDVSMFELTKNSYTFHYAEEKIRSIANNHVSNVRECIESIMK